MTLDNLKRTSDNEPVRNKKTKLKSGAKTEINEHHLDEILHINNY